MNRTELKEYILRLLMNEGKDVEVINYVFCTDEYLLGMSKKYLNHNTYTDILTFELSARASPIVSDIYISVERVRENARLFTTTFSKEMHRVIFHGALHLAGYKDKSISQSKLMRLKEEEYMDKYKISRNTVSARNI